MNNIFLIRTVDRQRLCKVSDIHNFLLNTCQQLDWTRHPGEAFKANQEFVDAIKTNRLQAKQKVQSAIEPAEDGGRTRTDKRREVLEIKPRIRVVCARCNTSPLPFIRRRRLRGLKSYLTPSVSAVAATRIGLNLRRRHGCKVALHLKSLATFAQIVRDGEVEFHVDAVEHETASCCKEGRASVHRGDQTNPHQSMIGLECIGLIAI